MASTVTRIPLSPASSPGLPLAGLPLAAAPPPDAVPAASPVTQSPVTENLVTESPVTERCASVLLLAVQLRCAREIGDVEATRRRIRELLDWTESQLQDAGLSAADTADVMFALVAALDEAVSTSAWEQKGTWLARPLQFERFSCFDAGDQFFARLGRVRQDRAAKADVLQVYYLCLALGFKGKYRVRRESEWKELIADLAEQLRRGHPAGRAELSPNGVAREEFDDAVREIPLWVVAVAAVTLAVLTYLVLTAVISQRAGGMGRLPGQP